MTPSNQKPILFILSGMRSGSTLLRAMLHCNSTLFAPDELHLIPFRTMKDRASQLKGTYLGQGVASAVRDLSKDRAEAEETLARLECGKTIDVYKWMEDRLGTRIFVDKSPTTTREPVHLERAEGLGWQLDREPRYILLTRHPLATIESIQRNGLDRMLRRIYANSARVQRQLDQLARDQSAFISGMGENGGKDPWHVAVDAWYRAYDNALAFLEEIPKRRQFHLTYENLVAHPEQAMKWLCRWLDIPFESAMLQPYKDPGGQGRKKENQPSVGDPNFQNHREIRTDLIHSWREKELPSLGEKEEVLAARLGYCQPPSRILPLSSTQKFFFRRVTCPNWMMMLTWEVRGPLDETKLGRAFSRLVEETPALRMSIIQHKGARLQKIGDEEAPAIKQIKLETVAAHERGALIDRHEKAILGEIMIEGQALPQLAVFLLADGHYRLSLGVHHLQADGVSLLNIHQRLWALYQEDAAPEEQGYSAYLDDMSHLEEAMPPEVETTWRNLIKGCQGLITSIPRGRGIDEGEMGKILELTRSKTHFSHAAVALYRVFSTVWETDRLLFAIRLGRRQPSSHHRYPNLIANMAGDVPLPLSLQGSAAEQIKAFNREFKAVSQQCMSWEWLHLRDRLPHLGRICPVRFNYVPLPRLTGPCGELTIADFSHRLMCAPENEREYPIDFILRQERERATVIVRYNRMHYTADFIQDLINAWEEQFTNMLEGK